MSTSVYVIELPDCGICNEQGITSTALYDAKTIWGPWSFLCQKCFELYGPPTLGTGFGQRLYDTKCDECGEPTLPKDLQLINVEQPRHGMRDPSPGYPGDLVCEECA